MKEDEAATACCSARFETLDDFELDLVQNHPSIVQSLWEVEKQRMQQYLDAQKELKRDIPLELPSGEKREATLRKLVEKRRRREEEQHTSTRDSGNSTMLGKEAGGVYSSSGSIRQRRVLERVQRQTVLSRTREGAMRGPLALLSRCVKQRLRLRVDLRGPVGLRSTLHCFVVAFDRHWNLCLRDVDERFFCPKRHSAFLSTAEQQDDDEKATPKCLFYKNEAGSKLGRHKRILQRHLNQLFIKGDNVIIIALLEAGSCSTDDR